jgi:hypothetical protein
MIVYVNSDFFPLTALSTVFDLGNGEELCFLWGTDWILKHYLGDLRLQKVNWICI